MKTACGMDESMHWIYTASCNEQSMFATMVVLKVRSLATKKGGHGDVYPVDQS
jgi:hypothetical protein